MMLTVVGAKFGSQACSRYTEHMLERFGNIPRPGKPEVPPALPEAIDDIDDAREHVAELIASGVHPVITIPEAFVADIMQYGITHVPKHDLLTDTVLSVLTRTFLKTRHARYSPLILRRCVLSHV